MLRCAVQWPAAVEEDLKGLMHVLGDVIRIIVEKQSKDESCTTWELRVHLATAILDLMMIDIEVQLQHLSTPHRRSH